MFANEKLAYLFCKLASVGTSVEIRLLLVFLGTISIETVIILFQVSLGTITLYIIIICSGSFLNIFL